eukprot:TRINITY_DN333_c0_g1_i7.p1 TRINITY_DN333_c0_g1~~TRINITY_DN333_c0_g1_i7.p1  ORF type:complete len:1873 (-),score=520.02 TRINITY_DN333_c0_g1_i7:1493-7015(-)
MGREIAYKDWSQCPTVGPLEDWSETLFTTVGIALGSKFAIVVFWGPKYVLIYNDAYIPVIGARHPKALGLEGERAWGEVWDYCVPMMDSVFGGVATYSEDVLLDVTRNGYVEECYMTWSYSPIFLLTGNVGGIFTPISETTSKPEGPTVYQDSIVPLMEKEERFYFHGTVLTSVSSTPPTPTIEGFRDLRLHSHRPNRAKYWAIREQDGLGVFLKIPIFPIIASKVHIKQELRELLQEANTLRTIQSKGIEGTSKIQDLLIDEEKRTVVMVVDDHPGAKTIVHHQVDKSFAPDYPLTLRSYMTTQELLTFAIQAMLTLSQVHRCSITIRNIRPEYVLWHPQKETYRFVEMGTSTLLQSAYKGKSRDSGALMYSSPEQISKEDVDHRTDIYSFGLVLYEAATGVHPYKDCIDIKLAITTIDPIEPHIVRSSIPLPLSHIIMKMISKSPDERYQSILGARTDLQTLQRFLESKDSEINFPLGRHDISYMTDWAAKGQLYGRDDVILDVLTCFDKVKNGPTNLVLMSGPAGIGKSATMRCISNRICKENLETRCFSSKLDQFHRIPSACFDPIIQDILLDILSKPHAHVLQWRSKLLDALGMNVSLMSSMFPLLSNIVGEQPPPAVLSADEAQNRFSHALSRFISCFCMESRPLIFCFEDLQWADERTLQQIYELCTFSNFHHSMVIITYRNDIPTNHPLHSFIQDIKGSSVEILEIPLKPFQLPDITQFLSNSLHAPPETVIPLSTVIFNKTKGNPLFSLELFRSMVKQNMITYRFDSTTGTAQLNWDLSRIDVIMQSPDIVDFVQDNMSKLSPESLKFLTWASCIGDKFSLKILSEAAGVPTKDLVSLIPNIQEAGFVSRVEIQDENSTSTSDCDELYEDYSEMIFAFTHDRIREAAYKQIKESDRPNIHMIIAKAYLKMAHDSGSDFLEVHLLEIASHIGESLQLFQLETQEFQLEIIELIYRATEKCKLSGAISDEFFYCLCGLFLLEIVPKVPTKTDQDFKLNLSKDSHHWTNRYHISRRLLEGLAEILIIRGNLAEPRRIYEFFLEISRNVLEKADAYHRLMILVATFGLVSEVPLMLKGIFTLLGVPEDEMGLCEPVKQSKINEQLSLQVEELIKSCDISKLIDLKVCTDQRELLITCAMGSLGSVGYLHFSEASIYFAYQSLIRGLRYGWTGTEGYNLLQLCGLYVQNGQINIGTQICELALRSSKLNYPHQRKLGENSYRSENFGINISVWKSWALAVTFSYPWRFSPAQLLAGADYALKLALESGDMTSCWMARAVRIPQYLFCSTLYQFVKILAEEKKHISGQSSAFRHMISCHVRGFRMLHRNLFDDFRKYTRNFPEISAEDRDWAENLKMTKNPFVCYYLITLGLSNFMMFPWEPQRALYLAWRNLKAMGGTIHNAYHRFLLGLSSMATLRLRKSSNDTCGHFDSVQVEINLIIQLENLPDPTEDDLWKIANESEKALSQWSSQSPLRSLRGMLQLVRAEIAFTKYFISRNNDVPKDPTPSMLSTVLKIVDSKIDENFLEISEMYSAAINSFSVFGNSNTMLDAISEEATGRFWEFGKSDRTSHTHLNNAFRYYTTWGALEKLKQMKLEFREILPEIPPEIIGVESDLSDTESLNGQVDGDVMSHATSPGREIETFKNASMHEVIASQATEIANDARHYVQSSNFQDEINLNFNLNQDRSIKEIAALVANEIILAKLLRLLCDALISLEKTQRVILLSPKGNPSKSPGNSMSWKIDAIATPEQCGVTNDDGTLDINIDTSYSFAIVNFTYHSQRAVILSDAALDPVFGKDPYVTSRHCRSIMSIPLYHGNQLVLVVYLGWYINSKLPIQS